MQRLWRNKPAWTEAQIRQGAIACASIISHRQRLIASIIVTAYAAPKITTNTRSPCAAARPQPSADSAESAATSPMPGSIQSPLHLALDVAPLGVVTQTASIQATQREKK